MWAVFDMGEAGIPEDSVGLPELPGLGVHQEPASETTDRLPDYVQELVGLVAAPYTDPKGFNHVYANGVYGNQVKRQGWVHDTGRPF